MKTWSVLFAAIALAALIGVCLGHIQQIFILIIAAFASFMCLMSHRDEQKFKL